MSRIQSAIVISRDGIPSGPRGEFEDALAALLRARGNPPLLIPPLYDLRPPHPAARRLRALARANLLLASWLPRRAAYWTFQALCAPARADLPAQGGRRAAAQSPGSPAQAAGRPRRSAHPDGGPVSQGAASGSVGVSCFELAAFGSVEACAEALAAAARAAAASAEAGLSGSPSPNASETAEIAEPAEPRWYPVIDYSLCTACRKCVDFCLFEVYSACEGRVVVSRPDNCKNGCPACARTCPRGAIMFPRYVADPAVAGAAPAVGAVPRPPRGSASTSPPPGAGTDPLDRLIGDLERLDA